MTILVFCPNLGGDTAMATPALRALRAGFPGSRMVAVIKPKVAPTLDVAPWPDDGPSLELDTPPEDEASADRAWTRLGLPRSGPVVTLNTGGAFGPAKSWPVGYFSILARRLVDEARVSVLVVCGPGEREAAR